MSSGGGGRCSRSTQTDQAKSKVINVSLFILKSGDFDDLDFKVVRKENGEERVVITYSDLFGVLGEDIDPVSITLSCDGVCRVYVLFCASLSYQLVNEGTFDAKTFVKILKQFQRSTVFCGGIPPQMIPSEQINRPDELKTHVQPFLRHQAKNCVIYYKTDIEIAEKNGLCQNCQLLLQKLKNPVPSQTLLSELCTNPGGAVSNIPTTVCELEVKLEPVGEEVEGTRPAFKDFFLSSPSPSASPSTSTCTQELVIAALNAGHGQEVSGDARSGQEVLGDTRNGQEVSGDVSEVQEVSGNARNGQEVSGDARNILEVSGDASEVQEVSEDARNGQEVSVDACEVQEMSGEAESGELGEPIDGYIKVEPTIASEIQTENNLECSISSFQTSPECDHRKKTLYTKPEVNTKPEIEMTTERDIKIEMDTEEYSEVISHARYPYVAKISTVRKRKQKPVKKSPKSGNSPVVVKKKTKLGYECVTPSVCNTAQTSTQSTEVKSSSSVNKVVEPLARSLVKTSVERSRMEISSASNTVEPSLETTEVKISSAINKGRMPKTDKIVELLQTVVKPLTFNVKMQSDNEMFVMKPVTKSSYDLLRIYKGQEKPSSTTYAVRLPSPLTTECQMSQLPSNKNGKPPTGHLDGVTQISNAIRMQLTDKLNGLQQSRKGQHLTVVAQPQTLYGQPQVQHNGLHLLTSVLASDPNVSDPSVSNPSVSDQGVPDASSAREDKRCISVPEPEVDDVKLCAQSLIELSNQRPAPAVGIPTTVTEMKEIPEFKEVKVQKKKNEGHAQCPVCFEFYSSETALLRHVRIHNVDRPFSCPVCNKSFGQKITMKVHMRLHTGEKPHQCYICERSFAQKSNMETHVRRHLGLRPFKCEHCGKGFSDKGTLDEHVKTHTGDQPYLCVVCGKSFSQRSHMRTHMKRHHDNKTPYACKKCTKSFKNKESLKQHVESHE